MRFKLPVLLSVSALLLGCGQEQDDSGMNQSATEGQAREAASQQPGAETVAINSDRQGLIALMDSYLAALLAHDSAGLPFSDELVFVENAEVREPGEGLWQSISAGADGFSLYVPDPVSEQVGYIGVIEENGEPVQVAIRLQVENGEIVAAEHLLARNLQDSQLENLQTPRAGLLSEIPEGERLPRAELLSTGFSYYDAVDMNDGSLAPFAEDCVRRENGWQTSTQPASESADDEMAILGQLGCAEQLDTNSMAYIDVINNRRVFIADPQTGLVFGLSHFRHSMEQQEYPLVGVPGLSVRQMDFEPFDLPAAHIFKVGADGQIHEIEAMGFMLPYNSPTGWGW